LPGGKERIPKVRGVDSKWEKIGPGGVRICVVNEVFFLGKGIADLASGLQGRSNPEKECRGPMAEELMERKGGGKKNKRTNRLSQKKKGGEQGDCSYVSSGGKRKITQIRASSEILAFEPRHGHRWPDTAR